MLNIYRSTYDSELNHFHGKTRIKREDVRVLTKHFDGKTYTYAEPNKEGCWAFGGTILFTSNAVYPEFTTPIKLHDRNMRLEKR
jgi:hypothetical protein